MSVDVRLKKISLNVTETVYCPDIEIQETFSPFSVCLLAITLYGNSQANSREPSLLCMFAIEPYTDTHGGF